MSEDVIAVNNQWIGGPLNQTYACRREVVFAVVCKQPTPKYSGNAWVFSGDSKLDEKGVKRQKQLSGGRNDNRAPFAIGFAPILADKRPFFATFLQLLARAFLQRRSRAISPKRRCINKLQRCVTL